jgi:hypothetical protein
MLDTKKHFPNSEVIFIRTGAGYQMTKQNYNTIALHSGISLYTACHMNRYKAMFVNDNPKKVAVIYVNYPCNHKHVVAARTHPDIVVVDELCIWTPPKEKKKKIKLTITTEITSQESDEIDVNIKIRPKKE